MDITQPTHGLKHHMVPYKSVQFSHFKILLRLQNQYVYGICTLGEKNMHDIKNFLHKNKTYPLIPFSVTFLKSTHMHPNIVIMLLWCERL